MTPRVDTLVLKEASVTPIGTCLSVGIGRFFLLPTREKEKQT